MRPETLAALAVPPTPEFLPRVLPAGWKILEVAADGAAYVRGDGLAVIVSAQEEQDGRRWLHVSCSRQKRLPSWEDLAVVKAVFVGADRYAYQVFAPRSKHVNIHNFCLHLWACLDAEAGAVLPDFTNGTGSL